MLQSHLQLLQSYAGRLERSLSVAFGAFVQLSRASNTTGARAFRDGPKPGLCSLVSTSEHPRTLPYTQAYYIVGKHLTCSVSIVGVLDCFKFARKYQLVLHTKHDSMSKTWNSRQAPADQTFRDMGFKQCDKPSGCSGTKILKLPLPRSLSISLSVSRSHSLSLSLSLSLSFSLSLLEPLAALPSAMQ